MTSFEMGQAFQDIWQYSKNCVNNEGVSLKKKEKTREDTNLREGRCR